MEAANNGETTNGIREIAPGIADMGGETGGSETGTETGGETRGRGRIRRSLKSAGTETGIGGGEEAPQSEEVEFPLPKQVTPKPRVAAKKSETLPKISPDMIASGIRTAFAFYGSRQHPVLQPAYQIAANDPNLKNAAESASRIIARMPVAIVEKAFALGDPIGLVVALATLYVTCEGRANQIKNQVAAAHAAQVETEVAGNDNQGGVTL